MPRNPWVAWKVHGVPPIYELDVFLLVSCKRGAAKLFYSQGRVPRIKKGWETELLPIPATFKSFLLSKPHIQRLQIARGTFTYSRNHSHFILIPVEFRVWVWILSSISKKTVHLMVSKTKTAKFIIHVIPKSQHIQD